MGNLVEPLLQQNKSLIDGFGRKIDYLRVSVTDRCDLRCTYCMAEDMQFLQRPEVLTLEEMDRLCSVFIGLGVRRLRLTGGEPLVRRDFMLLVQSLSRHLKTGALDELTLTTNGTQLKKYAEQLAAYGVRRINVSLDSLDRATFHKITRRDRLNDVLEGIGAAANAGIKVKINTVALAQDNKAELPNLISWAHQAGHDVSLIETMPLGEIDGSRNAQFLSLNSVRQELESYWTLEDLSEKTGGPSRYVRIVETGGKLGFITPLSHNFCETCNRVRLTCTGRLYLCLGQNDCVDLRAVLRASQADEAITQAIFGSMHIKPKSHDFSPDRLDKPALARFMSLTGG